MSPTSSLILLTGGSGFVGSCIALEALAKGCSVRLALRKRSQFDDWLNKYPEWKDKLSYIVVEDFGKEGAFDEAVKGVQHVVHTATPVIFAPKASCRASEEGGQQLISSSTYRTPSVT